MESRYIINIAYRLDGGTYRHWGRLDVGTSEALAIDRLRDTRERFPAPGFKVSLTYWECVGKSKPGWGEPS